MTDQTNGSSQETGKGRDSSVEAGCLNPLDVHLWLRKLQQLPDYTVRWQIHWWSAEGKCAWSWDHWDRRIKRLPVSRRAKGGINTLSNLIAQRYQQHATLQQNISEVLLLCYNQKKLDTTFSENNRKGYNSLQRLYICFWSYSSMLGCWVSLQHF